MIQGPVDPEVTPGKLLRFLKKHTLSSWSLKEALESSDDISEEIMGYARQ
jgi:type IV secretory pathway ATPase VirB11/archaellum biosynthesis ATPase